MLRGTKFSALFLALVLAGCGEKDARHNIADVGTDGPADQGMPVIAPQGNESA